MTTTLILTYSTTTTYRATVGREGGDSAMARAIEECLQRCGLLHGRSGIDPESIKFTVEKD